MFEVAVTESPHKSVDVVIANAGVGRGSGDPMMALEGLKPSPNHAATQLLLMSLDPNTTPTRPSMHIIDINLIGVMYTLKLAIHYFRRSPKAADRDRCFIFGGSVAGFVDNLVLFHPFRRERRC